MPSHEQQSESLQITPADLKPDFLCFTPQHVHEALGKLHFPQSITNPLTTEDEARDRLVAGGYTMYNDLTIPTENGRVDFKEIHAPLTARITERNEALLPGLSGFEYQYATSNGSTEAISRLMAGWITAGKMTKLGMIKGDYPGYEAEAAGLGIPVVAVDSLERLRYPGKGTIWFISNPSAVDGNWHNKEIWESFVQAGHSIVLDTAYMDLAADEHPLDVSAPNIEAVITSPANKPFGRVFDRYPGIAYTREMVFSLFIARAFRPIERLINMAELNSVFPPHELAREHTAQQQRICQAIGDLTGKEIKPSDTYLMAHTNAKLPSNFDHLLVDKKNSLYQFRLSTAFAIDSVNERAAEARPESA